MTTATQTEVQARRGRGAIPSTPFGRIAWVARRVSDEASQITWPSPRWRSNPVGFFRDVLGIEPWEKQIEICEAIRDHKRVAVKSGHKVSKSNTAAGIGLWFLSSFEDARVVGTCVTSRQVDEILYREVRKLHAGSGLCASCKEASAKRVEEGLAPIPKPCEHSAILDGEPKTLARSGIKLPDFRQLVGFTADEAEAVAGVSGKNLLYLVDEASGVDDAIFEAIEGNRAGGARLAMFSNPTRCEGEFFAAFDSKARFYKTITISSEDSPNVKAGREVIPGLATKEWVDEKREEYGEDSPFFKVRVKGEFVRNEEGKIISLHLLEQAKERWESTAAVGRLHIGIDPAGDSGTGDESVLVSRRGLRVTKLIAARGLSPAAHVVNLLGMISEQRTEREEKPIVKVDKDGEVGARVHAALAAHLERDPNAYELIGVRGGEWAKREKLVYERVRDEVWASTARWLRDGGAIPEDAKLDQDLHAPSWIHLVTGKQKATSKDDIKVILKGRSPDRGDALGLAVWELASWADETDAAAAQAKPTDLYETPREINAYELDGVGRAEDDYDGDDGPSGDGVYS